MGRGGWYKIPVSRRVLVVAVATVLAACQGGGPTTPTTPRRNASQAPASAAPSKPGPASPLPSAPAVGLPSAAPGATADAARVLGVVRLPAGLVANNGAGLVSNDGGGIIANHGGAILSNNGSGIVSNNGGAYHLSATPEQVPVAGLRVDLLDGAGDPILEDGQPVFTTTNAEGAYGFTVAPGDRNTLVRIGLPDGKGQAQAIVPRATARVDVDLVSTLTTTYILDRYVQGTGDAQATLDKLPADVEAETRARAAAALTEAPPDLTASRVTALVDDLRRADPALDAQLETVKKLLIAAGQSNLGDGQVGTAVSLVDARDLLVAPDGSLFFTAANGKAFDWKVPRRVWRLGPDGRLAAVYDGSPRALALDAAGRLTFIDHDPLVSPFNDSWTRVLAVGADGALVERLRVRDAYRFAVPDPDGGMLVVGVEDNAYVLERLPAQSSRPVAPPPLPAPDPAPAAVRIGKYAPTPELNHVLGDLRGLARVADGVILASRTALMKLGAAASPVTTLAAENARAMALGADGALWLEVDGKAVVRAPDGARTALAGTPPATYVAIKPEVAPNPFEPPPAQVPIMGAVARGADGTGYVSDGARIFRAKDGRFERVAGLEVGEAPPDQGAEALDLKTPAGLAVAPDGTLFVADRDAHRVYKIDPAGEVAVVAGTGEAGPSGDGGPATAAKLLRPTDLAIDPAGGLLVLDQTPADPEGLTRFKSTPGVVRRIAPDGSIAVRHQPPAGTIVRALLPRRGATPWVVSEYSATGEPPSPFGGAPTSMRVDALPATGPATVVRALAEDLTGFAGFAADGEGLYLWRGHELSRWTAPAGAIGLLKAFVGTKEVFNGVGEKGFVPELGGEAVPIGANRIAFDAAGRMTMALGDVKPGFGAFNHHVVRYDPKTDALQLLAGAGSALFAGTGVDDGLKNPLKPVYDAAGNLYFLDVDHRQVKRIPADKL